MRLAGIYVHGALTLAMIFIIGLQTGHYVVCMLAAASSGLAYLAEFVFHELYCVRHVPTENQKRFHMSIVYSSITMGILSCLLMFSNLWLTS